MILRSSRYTEMLLRQCVGHVRHIGCRGMPLSRRLSASADTRTVERRGDYTMLEDNDVTTFERLLGSSAVLTEPDDVAPYNEDWPRTCKGNGSVVLFPRSTEEVSGVLSHCYKRRLAVCPQGGNTGLVGGSVPLFDEIIISTSRMNQISSLDPLSGALVCQAGCILEILDGKAATEGLMMPLDLGSKGTCQIGGNVSTNAGGLRLLRYGPLHGTVLGLEAVLSDGTVVDSLQSLRKDNTGYDLKQLFIGSEGTLGLITQVAIQCPPRPNTTCVAFLGCQRYEEVLQVFRSARAALPEYLSSFEMMDRESLRCVRDNMKLRIPIEEHPFYVLIEVAGSDDDVVENSLLNFMEKAMDEGCVSDGVMAKDPSHVKELWNIREILGVALKMDGYAYMYDISLPLEMYNFAVDLLRERLGNHVARVCGFGHMADSNLHINVTTPTFSAEVLAMIEPFVYEWTAQQRGSISAEHGIGVHKKNFLHLVKSDAAIRTMRTLKQSLDPRGILNPYKVFPPEV